MIKEYKMITDLIDNIHKVQNMLKEEFEPNLINDLKDAMIGANKFVFNCCEINSNKAIYYTKTESEIDLDTFLQEVDLWCDIILSTLQKRSKLKNSLDREFSKLMDFIRLQDIDNILAYSINHIKNIRQSNQQLYQNLEIYYNCFENFWGGLNIDKEIFDVIEQRGHALKDHQEDFIWLYHRLSDYRSRKVLLGILNNWLNFNTSILSEIKENNFSDYYDLDLIQCDNNEVLVDIGAYIGDSAKSFIDTYGNYKRIYCYEITDESLEKCKNLLSGYENIVFVKKGAGSKTETKYFQKFGLDGSANRLSNHGEIPVEIAAIDDDISEKITFIKMDIEGSEKEALKGCKNHIMKDHPKLAICTYHNNEDIWKIPRIIDDINSDYKFYMRYNGKQLGPTEYVLFAL